MKQRLNWLDIAKAIAIILMVAGHSSIPLVVSNFIFAFHMPLFFIASGWTTDWGKYPFLDFVKRRTRSLLIPFVIYSAIVLLIHMHNGWMTMGNWLVKGWGDGYALWFIPVLFIATIIVKALYSFREVGGGRLFWIVVVLILCLGIVFHCFRIRLPWNFSSIPYALFLIIIGSELSKSSPLLHTEEKHYPVFFLLTFLIVATISHFWRLDMCFNNILPVFPLTIGAISGTIMVFLVSYYIESHCKRLSKVFISVGKETYIVVAFSQITIMLMNEYFQMNALFKYALLVVILVLIKYAKDIVNRVVGAKVL